MQRMLASITALLMSAAILFAGGGLQGTLIAVRANIEAFSLPVIGLLMSIYYLGFIAGCLMVPGMVRRAGHIRAFTALAAIAAATILTYAIEVNVWLWMVLRVFTGFSFAGLYMIIESWINEKADNENRGRVLSVYRVVDFSALSVGQFLLMLADPSGFVLFSIVAILISLSIVPVAMTRVEGPRPPAQTKLQIAKLWRLSPFAVVGSVAVGLANGAFWAIGPVYVQQLGYGTGMVASFMSAVILCGAVAQWPVGLISDKMDRRIVLIAVSFGAALSGLLLMAVGAHSPTALVVAAGVFGVFALPVFGLCAAHANDHADESDFVAVSGGLLLVFGVGSILGPVISPFVMTAFSPSALFGYTAAIHLALVAFGLYRLTQRSGVAVADQTDYVPVPRTTPAVFEIDPRGSSGEESQSDGAAAPA